MNIATHGPRMRTRVVGVAVLGIAAFSASSCSTEDRAERKAKEFADQVCKIKDSDSTDEAQRHVRKAQDDLDDLSRFVGRDIRDDLNDVDRNLDQLANDVERSGNVRQQDVNAISRNVQELQGTTSGVAEAVYDGMQEGLANCD
jgi:hypothetical protein